MDKRIRDPEQYRFPVDPDLKWNRDRDGHLPPKGHVRQCQGVCRAKGEQCRKWALKGRRFCESHGGRLPLRKKPVAGRYAAHVSQGLGEVLKAYANEAPDERADIAEEIDLQRALTVRAVKLYDEFVVQDKTNSQGDHLSPEKKAAVINLLRDNLESTTKLVERMVSIEAKRKDGKFDAHSIDFVVAQFGDIVARFVPDEEVQKQIANAVRDIKIPEHDPRVTLTPGE